MSRDIGACSETLTYSSELSSTGSCLHALRSWSCRLTPRPYERSVVLMAPGWTSASAETGIQAIKPHAPRAKVEDLTEAKSG